MNDLSGFVSNIEQQLWLNACGAHAGTTALEMLLAMRGETVELDRLFLYYNLRQMAGYGDDDKGSRVRDIPKALHEVGCPRVHRFQWLDDVLYSIGTLFGGWQKKPSSKRYRAALQYRIGSYEQVTNIRAALSKGSPVIVGMNLRKAFTFCDWGGYADSPITEKHIMVVAGCTDDAYLLVNSWGRLWGDGGMAWMPADLFSADCYEAWAVSL